jgi:dTDP-4-amino-4,6-dideoxygalactose transaminase
MITTNDPRLAARMRSLRSHGMTVSSWDRDKGRPAQYDVLELGYNFRFDDIRAALGLVQLEKLELFNRQRSKLVERYNQRLAEAKLNVTLPFMTVDNRKLPAYHIYPVVFSSTSVRDSLSELLQAEGIQTSIHYNPVHAFSAFRKIAPETHLPITEEFAGRELTLPLYPSLSPEQVDSIVSSVSRYEDSALVAIQLGRRQPHSIA